jgi:hypothetical protein
MMSDLAPFVAAVIRDRVVVELKDEIEALRQENAALKLEHHRHNPRRSIKVTGSNEKEIFAENELHLEVLYHFFGRKFCVCNPGGVARPDVPKVLWFKCGSWLTLELWIDGGSSVRLQDLSFHYTAYKYTYSTRQSEHKCVAIIEARDGDDLNLEILIVYSPDDHAKLLNREQRVDFLPPKPDGANTGFSIEDSLNQEIPLPHLLELCGETDAVVRLNNWKCTD